MYNGMGVQTARGTGTNGYVQSNKFFVRPKTPHKSFGLDQTAASFDQKPSTELLEHDRNRQVELKLIILEDKLSEQGYTDTGIAAQIDELRRKLEAEAAAAAVGNSVNL